MPQPFVKTAGYGGIQGSKGGERDKRLASLDVGRRQFIGTVTRAQVLEGEALR